MKSRVGYFIRSIRSNVLYFVSRWRFVDFSFFPGQNQTKTFQIADPYFRRYISVDGKYKIIHGRLEIRNLSLPLVAVQTEHSKINQGANSGLF